MDGEENVVQNVIVQNIDYEDYDSSQTPSIDDMENYDAIINGYIKNWEMDYTITENNLKYLDKDCTEIEVK
jgi:hypothetical protein